MTMTPERYRAWLKATGGTRFWLALGAGIVSSILVWFGKITSSDYVLVISATVASYIVGKSWERNKNESTVG